LLLLPQEVFEDATHYLVVRGAAEAMGDNPDVNYILVPGFGAAGEQGGGGD
jgi:hypothetical protein